MSMFKSFSRAKLLTLAAVLVAVLSGTGGWVLSQSNSQDIQAVLYNDAVRFKVQNPNITIMRAEIFNLGGRRLFDSGPKPGNTLDWSMLTESGLNALPLPSS